MFSSTIDLVIDVKLSRTVLAASSFAAACRHNTRPVGSLSQNTRRSRLKSLSANVSGRPVRALMRQAILRAIELRGQRLDEVLDRKGAA